MALDYCRKSAFGISCRVISLNALAKSTSGCDCDHRLTLREGTKAGSRTIRPGQKLRKERKQAQLVETPSRVAIENGLHAASRIGVTSAAVGM
jgi:hypothetical protein